MRKNLLKIPKLAEFPIDVGILASVLKPQVPIKPLYLLLSKNPKKKNKTESHFQTTRNQNLERFSYKQKNPTFFIHLLLKTNCCCCCVYARKFGLVNNPNQSQKHFDFVNGFFRAKQKIKTSRYHIH